MSGKIQKIQKLLAEEQALKQLRLQDLADPSEVRQALDDLAATKRLIARYDHIEKYPEMMGEAEYLREIGVPKWYTKLKDKVSNIQYQPLIDLIDEVLIAYDKDKSLPNREQKVKLNVLFKTFG